MEPKILTMDGFVEEPYAYDVHAQYNENLNNNVYNAFYGAYLQSISDGLTRNHYWSEFKGVVVSPQATTRIRQIRGFE